MSESHTHDCTGPDRRCQCGFVFAVPRFCVSIEVYDNEQKVTLVEDGFNTDSVSNVGAALRYAAAKVEALR